MKRHISFILLLVLFTSMLCAATEYSSIDPSTLPQYTGSLDNPQIRVIYIDASRRYAFVFFNGYICSCLLDDEE